MSFVIFSILLGAMGASVFTQRSQAGFSPVSPALAAIASHDLLPSGWCGWRSGNSRAVDGYFRWVGGDVIDLWQYIGTGMLQSSLNLRHLQRNERLQVVPLWVTEWRQANEGIYFTLNPKAKWLDGTPATAEDFKANVEAMMGKYAPERRPPAGPVA